MRIEIQVHRGHLPWGKKEQGSDKIDCKALFEEYWSTTTHEFPVRGQLESTRLLSPLTERAQRTLSLESIVTRWSYYSLQK